MRFAAMILIPVVLAGCGVEPPATPDLAGVKTLLDRQAIDWNARDLDGFLAGYWNSPGVVFQSGGDRSDGWEAMRDRYRRNYQAEGKEMGTLAFSGVEVVGLGHDSAMARGRWALAKSDGSRPEGLFTLILRRFPDGWRIVHDHTSIAAPARP